MTKKLKICLAASGGGHLRQIMDLTPAWGAHDHFFVSEKTPLSASIANDHRLFTLPHFAFGQLRSKRVFSAAAAALVGLVKSLVLMGKERPTYLITTGAGSAFLPVIAARLFGAKIVVIETFARFDSPSLFSRLAMPLAHWRVVQSRHLASRWRDSRLFDPLVILPSKTVEKKLLVLATVGASFPFPRLIDLVLNAKQSGHIPQHLIIQSGRELDSLSQTDGVEIIPDIPNEAMIQMMRDADIVICHGGTGSIITALREGCKVIAIPRLRKLGEHYDDHQLELVNAFEQRGLLVMAETEAELQTALLEMGQRARVFATTRPDALNAFLSEIIEGGRTQDTNG